MSIAKRIRERRDKLGLSQADLAKQCDTSAHMISQYETGHRVPGRLEVICGLAKALECSADYLLGLDDKKG